MQVAGALAAVAKVNYSRTLVDSLTARLHYQWSTTFCILAGALVIAKDYIGDAVECLLAGNDAPKYINTYCWITSTFTINSTDGESRLPRLCLFAHHSSVECARRGMEKKGNG